MTDQDTIETLNDLIETSHDGEYGFGQCAEHVESAELRTLLQQRADDCRRAASELREQVMRLGGEPDSGGSAIGALHRGWVSVRNILSSSSDAAMVAECERGEDAALARYREAAQQPLPPAVKAIVERQLQGVQRNHDQIRALRSRFGAAG